MRPLRYSINVTPDGGCDHQAFLPDDELHHHFAESLERADALLFGRMTYEMMEEVWRQPATETWPDWMDDWMIPFADAMDRAKKYVVSGSLDQVDWNAELVRGDLKEAVQQLKQESGKGLYVGGVTLPLALAELGLIDEYEFVVHPGPGRPWADVVRRPERGAQAEARRATRVPGGRGRSALPAQSSRSLSREDPARAISNGSGHRFSWYRAARIFSPKVCGFRLPAVPSARSC